MSGWMMHIAYLSSYPLGPPMAISYRNDQKSLACFGHLAPLVSFSSTERRRQKGGHGPMFGIQSSEFTDILLKMALKEVAENLIKESRKIEASLAQLALHVEENISSAVKACCLRSTGASN